MRYTQHPQPWVGNSQMEREPQLQGFSPRTEASKPWLRLPGPGTLHLVNEPGDVWL